MTKIMSILESDLGLIINPLKPSKTFMTITFRLRSHRRRRFVDDQWFFFFGIEMMWTSNPNRWRRPNPTAVLNISRFTGSCIAAPFPFLPCLCYGFLVICVIRPVLNPNRGEPVDLTLLPSLMIVTMMMMMMMFMMPIINFNNALPKQTWWAAKETDRINGIMMTPL